MYLLLTVQENELSVPCSYICISSVTEFSPNKSKFTPTPTPNSKSSPCKILLRKQPSGSPENMTSNQPSIKYIPLSWDRVAVAAGCPRSDGIYSIIPSAWKTSKAPNHPEFSWQERRKQSCYDMMALKNV